jgi:predicted ATPase
MESLFPLVKTQRILFINVFRPNHKETGDRIEETIKETLPKYYTEIKLNPLDDRMSEVLIDNMLNIKRFHYAMIEKIVERSGGNPFFIEEVVRSFIDDGAVVIKDGDFEVTEKINNMVVPNTIYDVLMARIDRLEEKTRNLLKVASVIGRSFFYRILAEVAKAIKEIEEKLSYLEEIQLIHKSRRVDELEYMFKHALAQEAAYGSLLQEKRKELHHKIAVCIENIFKERLHEFYGMLAYHYSKAEYEEKCEHYLIKAGEEALKTSASNEALHYYKEALNLYKIRCADAIDLDKIAILEKNIAIALYNKGKGPEAIEYFDRVMEYYGAKSPTRMISTAFKFLFCFLDFLIGLYLPVLKFKKTPTDRDREIIEFSRKKVLML